MSVAWADSRWLLPAVGALVLISGGVAWQYARARQLPILLRWLAGGLKILGFAALLLMLPDPQILRKVARAGNNSIVVLVDNSASMGIADQPDGKRRGDLALDWLSIGDWQKRTGETFRLRRYTFDSTAHLSEKFDTLTFDGRQSSLVGALNRISRPSGADSIAGIVVMTDGAITDADASLPRDLPPIYPLPVDAPVGTVDVSIERATATATVFESAPVTIDATLRCLGASSRPITVHLLDASGHIVDGQTLTPSSDDDTLAVRFLTTPKTSGPASYRVEARIDNDRVPQNNTWHVVANRDRGPFRVLYVSGTPNWEHKFFRRAIDDDRDVQLASLLRIARGAAQMGWSDGGDDRTHPFYQGQKPADEAERYDEPVFMRLGVRDSSDLSGGFPSEESELFGYDAVVLDNVEAGAFTPDQLSLLRKYTSERGGSLVMLGGLDSLDVGGYENTPVAELLPVYLGRKSNTAPRTPVRLSWTREGMLHPWMRLRTTEEAERGRVAQMPDFHVAHALDALKPGAQTLAMLEDSAGVARPAVVSQRFGNGRSVAFLVGDLWRWGLRDSESRADLETFWRQMVRGVLADVPRRASLTVDAPDGGDVVVSVTCLGPDFRATERATATARVRDPSGEWREVALQADPDHPGRAEAKIRAAAAGPWIAEAVVRDATDGTTTKLESGFAINADAVEFRTRGNSRQTLDSLATSTGGRVLTPEDLSRLPEILDRSPRLLTETESTPLWHHAAWLTLAIGCFVGEWGLRRWKGLA